MTGGSEENSGSLSGAPVDADRLAVIQERLATDDRFCQVDQQPAFAPERLGCVYLMFLDQLESTNSSSDDRS